MSNDIDSMLAEESEPHYTARRPTLVGSFNLSRASIPYFQSVMKLSEVAKELQLVENLPSDLRAKWKLEELFQREIDWERVDKEIVKGYLERPEKLQFFNSLTVALLPTDANRMLADTYGEPIAPPDLPENLKREPWVATNVGNVEIITNQKTPNGYLRWDPVRIFPATIDGQHRLAALQTHLREGNLTVRQLESSVSVIFLVLDERAGFRIEQGQVADDENPILTVVREIFIDLNHTAKEVARSRRILLDDQEIESRCVRSLLAPRVGERMDGRLPLGLVHWQHKVGAKFNSGDNTAPFVTTVELLYSIVGDMLDLQRPKDPLDDTQVRKFVRSVEEALGVSKSIAEHPDRYPNLPPLLTYVERNSLREGAEQPFANLPGPYLRVADDGFHDRWLKPIVTVLTKFQPYREFIEKVESKGGVDGDIAFYLSLPLKAQRQQVEEWGEDRHQKLDEPLRELAKMKLDDWPFFAVFQKALLRATKAALLHPNTIKELRGASQDDVLDAWILFLDTCWQRELFAIKASVNTVGASTLWAGVSLNPGSETVKWSEVSVQRISQLLLLWWYIYSNRLSKVGQFMKKAQGARGDESFPGAKIAIKSLQKGMRQAILYGEEGLEQPEIEKRIEKRLREILQLGRHTGADGSHDDDSGVENGAKDSQGT